MRKQLIDDISFDLSIESYEGEDEQRFRSRLVYSAISMWMKYILLDHMISEEDFEVKTKNYHYRRTREILEEYLRLFPEIRDWIYPTSKINPIHEIRNRLLACGEINEIDLTGKITLPKAKLFTINKTTSRLIDLNKKHDKYVGLTKIIHSNNDVKIKKYANNSLEIIKEFSSPSIFQEIDGLPQNYKLFNVGNNKNDKMYWIDKGKLNTEINLIRSEMYNESYWEYRIILKNSHGLYSYIIHTELIKQGIHLYFMLGLRLLYGEPINATYTIKNQVVKLSLGVRLPVKEEVFLQTFSWPENNAFDYRHYIVPIEVWDVISILLEELGFKLKGIER